MGGVIVIVARSARLPLPCGDERALPCAGSRFPPPRYLVHTETNKASTARIFAHVVGRLNFGS